MIKSIYPRNRTDQLTWGYENFFNIYYIYIKPESGSVTSSSSQAIQLNSQSSSYLANRASAAASAAMATKLRRHHHYLPRSLSWLPFSSCPSQPRPPPPNKLPTNPFIVDYLITSCGLSRKAAVAASPSLAAVKSAEGPNSVLSFLKSSGLSNTQITRFVSRQPLLLRCDVAKFLAPRFKLFHDLGMSGADTASILQKTKLLANMSDAYLARRIVFLRSIVPDDEVLIKVIKRSIWSLTAYDVICERMVANMAKLKEVGIPDEKIYSFFIKNPRIFHLNPDRIGKTISKVEETLNVPRDSGMFLYAVSSLCRLSDRKLRSKIQVLEEFGWSVSEVDTLLKSQPQCLMISDEKLRKGLGFLMTTAGLDPSYIAKHGTLLMMSLDKRISPRYNVISKLKSMNLVEEKVSVYSALLLSNLSFQEKFVIKYQDEAPYVIQAYVNAVGSRLKKKKKK